MEMCLIASQEFRPDDTSGDEPINLDIRSPLDEVGTPSLLLDRGLLIANLEKMKVRLRPHEVALRPHLKTAKSIEVADLAAPSKGPITVSTLREAEAFFAAGFTDILYAVAITPAKLRHAAQLIGRGCQLKIVVDSPQCAKAVREYGAINLSEFAVLIEIDTDAHRSGIPPTDAVLLSTASALEGTGARLQGVMTHAGGAYDCASPSAIRAHAEKERSGIVEAADRLRDAGFDCPIVSLGSTPTVSFGENFEGITEVRAGAFMFQDLMQRDLGVCQQSDIAISLLCSVIGIQSEEAGGGVLVDAGWMAMSQDRSPSPLPVGDGFGVVCDSCGEPIDGLVLAVLNQEHGIVLHREGHAIDHAQFPVGRQLRILPHHACATAGQHGEFVVLDDNGEVTARWVRHRGW